MDLSSAEATLKTSIPTCVTLMKQESLRSRHHVSEDASAYTNVRELCDAANLPLDTTLNCQRYQETTER